MTKSRIPEQTIAKIEEMAKNEGIVTIKGHGFGPEVTVEKSWDRFGPRIYACKPTLAETIDDAHDQWTKDRAAMIAETDAAFRITLTEEATDGR